MNSTPQRNRWFQFGLRELFWMTLVIALTLFGMLERQRRIEGDAEIQKMKEARRKLEYQLKEQAEHPNGHWVGTPPRLQL